MFETYFSLFLNSLAISALVIMILITYKRKNVKGGNQFVFLTSFMAIWAFSSFFETLISDYGNMLFWRNITQIGAYFLPVAFLHFSIIYTDGNAAKAKKLMILLYLIQSIFLILIFTDEYTHLMRASVKIISIGTFEILKVSSTPLGIFSISLHPIFAIYGLIRLLLFTRNTSGTSKNQIWIVFFGSLIPFIFIWLKAMIPSVVHLSIPMSSSFFPGSLLVLYGVYKYDFLAISPIARNKIFDMVKDGIIVCTSNGRIVDFNDGAAKLLGKIGINLDNRYLKDFYRPEFDKWFENVENMNESISEFRIKTRENNHDFEIQIFIINDKNEKNILGTISILREITEYKKKNEELEIKACTDGLTGVLNRNAFIGTFNSVVSTNSAKGFGILLIDIDHFKNVNDNYGHICGDTVLRKIVLNIEKSIRSADRIGRIGGEEFAILLPDISSDETKEISERIRQNVEKAAFEYSDIEIKISISIGATHIDNTNYPEFKDAFTYVDKLLYQSKNNGRNTGTFKEYEI